MAPTNEELKRAGFTEEQIADIQRRDVRLEDIRPGMTKAEAERVHAHLAKLYRESTGQTRLSIDLVTSG